ncbi:Uncharacterized protein OBRU01_01517, partial [Operophtera brumata]
MLPSMPILFSKESQDAFGNKIEPSTSFLSQNSDPLIPKPVINPEPPPDTPQVAPNVQKAVKTKEEPEKKKNEPPNDTALENAFVKSYYSRVQRRFSYNPSVPTNKFVQFQNILRNFNPGTETPIELYKKVEQLFGAEHKDMVEDFLLFLKPGQAAQVGRFMDRFSLVRMTGFIDLLHPKTNTLFQYLNGRVFLQHGRLLRSARVTFPYSKEPYRVHARRLAPLHSHLSPPDSDDETQKKTKQPQKRPRKQTKSPTKKDVNDNTKKDLIMSPKPKKPQKPKNGKKEPEVKQDNGQKRERKDSKNATVKKDPVENTQVLKKEQIEPPKVKQPKLEAAVNESTKVKEPIETTKVKQPKVEQTINENVKVKELKEAPKIKQLKIDTKVSENKVRQPIETTKVTQPKIEATVSVETTNIEKINNWTRDEDKTMLQVLKGEAGSEKVFEREQVPTQTVMIKTMTPPLAAVYFKSMTSKLKVLAGFEPTMKGGGSDWYQPPKDILEGRAVLKPIKKEYLKKLSYEGIGFFGEQFVADHHKQMEEEKRKVLLENDINRKKTIEVSSRQQWEDSSRQAANENTAAIQNAFREFTILYSTSISKIEQILFDAAVKEVKTMRGEAFDKMKKHYATLVQQQATMLYDRYTDKLMKEKARLKADFILKVEESRTLLGEDIHDLNVEKHTIVEKLRQLLESQNLACQVYVALKEREECKKAIHLSQYEHKKKVKKLKEQIALKDFELRLAQEKERKRLYFIQIWKKKVCHLVKNLQLFVAFCLNTLPDHADFFIDMEKLMMLQLSEAIENPSAESIFEVDDEKFHTPVAKPHPFYLFCDKDYKPEIDQSLCPTHCTSSASQLPVIVVNKQLIYGVCDKFEKFTDKVAQFIHGRRGDDSDFDDHHEYNRDVPVQFSSSQQRLELKLESSMLNVLQNELPNVKEVPVECCVCKIPYCFCSPLHASQMSLNLPQETRKQPSVHSIPSGNKIETRNVELEHEREPKWESYMKYVKSKRCKCSKTAKKHLEEHLPAYMRNMSVFDSPDLPNYEMCDLGALKKLVKKAQGKRPHTPPPSKVPSNTHEVGTQYSDQQLDILCTCLSDDQLYKFLKELGEGSEPLNETNEQTFKIIGGDVSPSYLHK